MFPWALPGFDDEGGGVGGFPGIMRQGEHKLLNMREKPLDMFND